MNHAYRGAHWSIAVLLVVLTGCADAAFTGIDEQEATTNRDAADGAAVRGGGAALAFDGLDDYVQVPDAPSLALTNGFTIAAWIYLDAYTEWASIVTKGGPGDDNNYTLHQSGPDGGSDFGHIRFTGTSPALPLYLESDTRIPLQEWHYVAVTYDGTELRFYYDGRPDGGGFLPGPLGPNPDPLHIGADFPGGDEFWHGRIDEVRIWTVPLRETHIRAAMNGHAAPMAASLVGYWRFDEQAGDAVRDRSPQGNDGHLVNGPARITPGAPIGRSGS